MEDLVTNVQNLVVTYHPQFLSFFGGTLLPWIWSTLRSSVVNWFSYRPSTPMALTIFNMLKNDMWELVDVDSSEIKSGNVIVRVYDNEAAISKIEINNNRLPALPTKDSRNLATMVQKIKRNLREQYCANLLKNNNV